MTSIRNHTDESGAQTPPRRGIPWPFILIVAIITLPIVAAYVAYYTGIGVSDETVNKGVLLQPAVKLEDLTSGVAAESLPDLSERKWRILLPVTTPCNEDCGNNLYITRQVHIRLGDDSPRVERIAVNLAGEEGEAFLAGIKDEHPLLKHFSIAPAQWDNWLANADVPQSYEQTPYYLLVDQQGFAMMYYTADHSGNDLLDDIKRLLRYTPE